MGAEDDHMEGTYGVPSPAACHREVDSSHSRANTASSHPAARGGRALNYGGLDGPDVAGLGSLGSSRYGLFQRPAEQRLG